jgi:hypothetical protein
MFFKSLRKGFAPPAKLADESLAFNAPPGSIFLMRHSQLELGVAKVLQENSHRLAIITAGPDRPEILELFALTPVPDFIRRSSDCLLLARQALANSKSIMMVVDYRVFDEGQKQYLYKIGITAFVFAQKMLRPIFFVKPEINSDGEIECAFRQSSVKGSANEIAEEFRSFVGGDLPIGDWFADTGGKLNAVIPARNLSG